MGSQASVRAAPRSLPWAGFVAGAVVLAYLVWTLPGVRPTGAFHALGDGFLRVAAWVLVLAVALVWVHGRRGAANGCVVAAVALRTGATAFTVVSLARGEPLPYPSWADAGWVGASLLLLAAVLLRLRGHEPRLPIMVALDTLAASLTLVGFLVLLLSGPVRTITAMPDTLSDATAGNLLYPVLDTGLLIALAAFTTTVRSRLTRSDVVLVVSIALSVAVDVTFFLLLSAGDWRPGSLLAGLSLLATGLLALVVRLDTASRPEVERRLIGVLPAWSTAPGIAVPGGLFLVSLLGLGLTSVGSDAAATACFAAAALTSATRGVRTLAGDRKAAGTVLGLAAADLRQFQALVEASNDLIGIADPGGRIDYLNPRGQELLRMPADSDVRSLRVADVVPGTGHASFRERWPVLLERGSWQGEADLLPLDGSSPVPVAISTFVLHDAQGRPYALATIQRDISELRRQEAALRDIADQRARLLNRLVEAQEAERAQIAADVHDDSVQALAVVDLRMGVLRRRAAAGAPDLLATVDDVQKSVSTATDRLRHLLFDLESPAQEAGLRSALATAGEVVFADTDVDCRVVGLDDLDLGDAERITAYRVAREAMVNARKHADAEHVTVALARDGDALVVTVSDDGRGFSPGDAVERPGHLGLAAMQDRASVAGGDLSVTASPTGGTVVRLSLPLRA